MIRLNDPSRAHSIQTGAGCDGGPNCSADPRFTNDPVNYTHSFATGYPVCIPSTIVPVDGNGAFTTPRRSGADPVTGVGDPFCPDGNRPAVAVDPVAADSTRFAPLELGDNVFLSGNFETVNGVRFLSAHTVLVNVALMTRDDPTQPDYVQVNEVVWELPYFGFNRLRFRVGGQGTLPASDQTGLGTDVDVFANRVDPRDNSNRGDPLASTVNNPGTSGLGSRPRGVNIWKIDYDVTFPPLAVKPDQPCTNLLNAGLLVGAAADKCVNGGTLEENFSVLSPVARELFARTRHKAAAIAAAARQNGPPVPQTLDIMGSAANQGEYTRPLGIGLGGLKPPEPLGFDLNLTPMPFVLEGLPWLLDRRVGPGGCAAAGCEPLATFAIGTLAAAPFPISGFTPDDVITAIAGAQPIVPVPGRPATFFEFDSATQTFTTDFLPLVADDQCPVTTNAVNVSTATKTTTATVATVATAGCALAGATRPAADGLLVLLAVVVSMMCRRARSVQS
jgi:hypothetical protein